MGFIADRVGMARLGTNPYVITKMRSGWAVLGDVQPLDGYCLLLADPVACDLNALSTEARRVFLEDMTMLGDAIMQATNCIRINYEILGNLVPELHAHVIPRYSDEPESLRHLPPMSAYNWNASSPTYPQGSNQAFIETLRNILNPQP